MSERNPTNANAVKPEADVPSSVKAFASFYNAVAGVGRLVGRVASSVVEATRTFFRSVASSFVERTNPSRSRVNERIYDFPTPDRQSRAPSVLRDIQRIWRSPTSLINKLASIVGTIIGALISAAIVLVKTAIDYTLNTARNIFRGRAPSPPGVGVEIARNGVLSQPTVSGQDRKVNGVFTSTVPLNDRQIDKLAEKLSDRLGILSSSQAATYLDKLQSFKVFGKTYSAQEVAAALAKTPFAHYTFYLGQQYMTRVPLDHPLQLTTEKGRIIEINGRLNDISYLKDLMKYYGKDSSFTTNLAMALYTRLPVAQAAEIAKELKLPRIDSFMMVDLQKNFAFRGSTLVYTHLDQHGHRVDHVLPYNEHSKEWLRQNLRDRSSIAIDVLFYRWEQQAEIARALENMRPSTSTVSVEKAAPASTTTREAIDADASTSKGPSIDPNPTRLDLRVVFQQQPERDRAAGEPQAPAASSPDSPRPSTENTSPSAQPPSNDRGPDDDRKRQGGLGL